MKVKYPPFLQFSGRTLSHEKYPFTRDFGNTHAVPPTPEWGGRELRPVSGVRRVSNAHLTFIFLINLSKNLKHNISGLKEQQTLLHHCPTMEFFPQSIVLHKFVIVDNINTQVSTAAASQQHTWHYIGTCTCVYTVHALHCRLGYTGCPKNNGTVNFQDFALINSYIFSPCWIEHLFLFIITPRSFNLVKKFLFYEYFLMDCHFRALPLSFHWWVALKIWNSRFF